MRERSIPRLRSLRVRSILVVLAVVLLPLVLVAITSWDEKLVGRRLEQNVREGADDAALVLREAPTDARPARLEEVARRRDVRVRVLDAEGRSLLDVDHDQGTHPLRAFGALFFGPDGAPTLDAFDATLGPVLARPEATAARAGATNIRCRTSEGSKLLVCSAAREDAGRLVYVQESSRRPVRALYDLRYELFKLVLVMLPVGLLLAWWLGWRAVRPIEKLRRQILAKTAVAAPGADLDLPRSDEIGDLATAFNALLRTLDVRRAQNEAFVVDLVHELKNPVAAIRACADSLETRAGGDPRDERLARVLADSSQRLDTLVTQFLELARAEAGLPNEARSRIDMAALAHGVASALRATERYPGVTIDVTAEAGAEVIGVLHRLDSALRNLIENAASFAAPSGEVRVSAAVTGRAIEIAVTDSGPGIAEADLPRVFDRFFTTRGRAQGTGLGLALVKAVAAAHGGSLHAESVPGTGATFRLILPRAA
jgi:two-component system sensor histidine kinase ChvG